MCWWIKLVDLENMISQSVGLFKKYFVLPDEEIVNSVVGTKNTAESALRVRPCVFIFGNPGPVLDFHKFYSLLLIFFHSSHWRPAEVGFVGNSIQDVGNNQQADTNAYLYMSSSTLILRHGHGNSFYCLMQMNAQIRKTISLLFTAMKKFFPFGSFAGYLNFSFVLLSAPLG